MNLSLNLLSAPNAQVKIGKVEFGIGNPLIRKSNEFSHDMITNISVNRTTMNDLSVNTYNISLVYSPWYVNSDPNYIEKVLAVSNMYMTISYGDASPTTQDSLVVDASSTSYYYRKLLVMITGYSVSFDISSGSFIYNISGVSDVWSLKEKKIGEDDGYGVVPKGTKISDRIIDVYNKYLRSFYDNNDLKIDTDDKVLKEDYELTAKSGRRPMSYISDLVRVMQWDQETSSDIGNGTVYQMYTQDSEVGKSLCIKRVKTIEELGDTPIKFNIEVGTKDSRVVSMSFSNSQGISHLYSLSQSSDDENELSESTKEYDIDSSGNIVERKKSLSSNGTTTEYSEVRTQNWWNFMQVNAISTNVEVHGLLKDANIMDIVQLDIYYSGNKYVQSGYYYINKISEVVGLSGYHTTLSMNKLPSNKSQEVYNNGVVYNIGV